MNSSYLSMMGVSILSFAPEIYNTRVKLPLATLQTKRYSKATTHSGYKQSSSDCAPRTSRISPPLGHIFFKMVPRTTVSGLHVGSPDAGSHFFILCPIG